ncbi:fimbrial protein [Enterobacter quasiroggenkampii]|uniref:fimbrial protein n=1 Tax=Enterobacter quasiroggenkampii TaxID=2497436 RepID=UPI0021CF31CF|nr:fimbrial protein [Enterobacter quasiroggenkampii]
MKFFVSIFIALLLISNFAVASDTDIASAEDCSTNGVTVSLSGEVHFQRDAPVGQESEPIASGSSSQTLTCGNISTTADHDVYYEFKANSQLGIAGNDGVFKTNLSGVGVKYYLVISNFSGFTSCNYTNTSQNYVLSSGYTRIICHMLHDSSQAAVTVTVKSVLVKLEPLITSGVLTGVPSNIDVRYELNYDSTSYDRADISVVSNTNVLSDKCLLSNNLMAFDIGDIGADSFTNQIGFIPGKQALQNLHLSCDADANINITLKGIQNTDVSDPSVLSLTDQGKSGVADGIGIQLVYNDVPLELNKILTLKRSSGGQETFPLTARYYQTKTKVKPGIANAAATLDITYQ